MSSTPTVYFGYPLSNVTQEYRVRGVQIRSELVQHYKILEFYSNPAEMNFDQNSLIICQDIYNWDKNCVESCDVFVAFGDYPSTGLGMELAFAISSKKPILLLCQKGNLISRMPKGITGTIFEYAEYQGDTELLPIIQTFIEKHSQN